MKYSKEKPDIKISASVVSEIDPKFGPVNFGMMEYHQIIVSDNGIGFEPEYANLIFSIFQRLHGKQEYSGTGIGLALCRKIMDNHNGYIFAQGNPGNGSMFFVYLPIDRKD